MNSIFKKTFDSQKEYFNSTHRFSSIRERKKILKSMKTWILKNQSKIESAIYSDFKKPKLEVQTTEIYPLISAIKNACRNLDKWAAPKKVDAKLTYLFTKSQIHKQPKGVTLHISPWNYPFMLALEPTISAISAGCTVILKPSEHTPNSAALLEEMAMELFSPKVFSVFTGDYLVSKELLKLPFNHIFFTGGTSVGKIIMAEASKNLTSVTLELGGMNPCIVDETANLKDAAEKILWTKCLNAAQSCVSINEIWIHESKFINLKAALEQASKKLYPKGFQEEQEMARIVNTNHFNRLKTLKEEAIKAGAEVLFGGEENEDSRFIGPTFLTKVSASAAIRNEEIFGPLVSVILYKNIDDVYNYWYSKPIPLAAYYYSGSRKAKDVFRNSIQAGSTCINDCKLQFAHDELPFGGQNSSGIGKAHGEAGFLEFTNLKSEVTNKRGLTLAKQIYPPYHKKFKAHIVKNMIRWF